MGNRAIVVFHSPGNPDAKERDQISPAIYLHWNGGPESIYGFLDELDRRNVRTSAADIGYEAARFVHVVGDFFDGGSEKEAGGLSLGIYPGPKSITVKSLAAIPADNGDNGVYVITRHDTKGKRTVRRFTFYPTGREWTADEVKAEHDAAVAHSYNTGEGSIRDQFVAMRPKISKYG